MFKPVDPKPNFPKIEEGILKFWENEKIFEKSLSQTKDGEPFVFFEGPPTANAAPGIHHVEARAFKDVIPRYQTMRGKYVLRKAGWDTHGLPVELQIEKKLGISGKKQIESLKPTVKESIEYFNKLCRESVWQYKEEWENLTRRMGFWLDLEHPYITYENSYIEKVWGILKQVWENGLLSHGHKVVPYCPRCGTALSSHEVAQGYETVTDNSVYVKFKLKNQPNTFILSWTTTPWTLPGNLALAVGQDIEYVKVKTRDENQQDFFVILSKKVYEDAKKNTHPLYGIIGSMLDYGRDHGKDLGFDVEEYEGKELVGLGYEPLFEVKGIKGDKGVEKAYKVYAADFVTTTDGTGVVHTAVMYGEDDYKLGEEIGLPKHHTVDEEGRFTNDVLGLGALKVKDKDTEQRIFDHLKSKNLLLKTEPYQHEYPFCWRCGTALLYYARSSWFIKMSELRKKLQQNNKKIKWVPEHIKEGRFGEWLKEAKDWAFSRERYWGTPLPIWKCQKCGELKIVGSIKELGQDNDLHRPYVDEIKFQCHKCKGEMNRVPEVLDVWFDSGAMPFASGQDQFPADYISEAIDQTRGWFYTLLAVSTLLDKGAPYQNVICLGHVLDEKGKKMSKSKGNVVNPFELGDKYGFDIIRWYFYSVNQPGDPKLFAEKDLQGLQRRAQVILWNVYNYFVTYANAVSWQFDSKNPEKYTESGNILDSWLSARFQHLINTVSKNLDEYDPFHATREIESFVEEMSTWYLRRSRGRSDEFFFGNLFHTLINLTKVLAPFMPFISEEIYRNLQNEGFAESVHLAEWPETKKISKKQQELLEQMGKLRKIVEEAHALRAKAGIKLRQPLARLTIASDLSRPRLGGAALPTPGEGKRRAEFLEILKDEVNVKEVVFGDKLELDTNLTEDLKLEGLTRELERQIQNLRKESGLRVGQIAELYYQTESAMIEKAMQKVDRKKTYLRQLKVKNEKLKVDFETEIQVDGETVIFYFRL